MSVEGRPRREGGSDRPIRNQLFPIAPDRDIVQLMRAYLRGILTGRTDWQKYLELIGAGGTGKSTITRLATALIGQENVHTTTLQKLEKSKFEPASIAGKRLVLINDSEKYAGDVGRLKNLTGQDSLPFEAKFKQSKGGFFPSALVIVSTNEVILSSDYTSGLARRRISVPMNKQIKGSKQKNLIEQKNDKMYGEFLPYIPGLLNWVLEMDEERATSIVKNYEEEVPSLLAMKARTLVETNPIADWLDNKIVYDAKAKTNIGVAKRDRDNNSSTWYLETEQWLYASYCEHGQSTGTKPVCLRRFVSLLSDVAKNQLGLKVERGRDRFGSYFEGLRIRGKNETSPPMITGNTEVVINTKVQVDNTNVINKLWNLVMDKVTDVMDYVLKDTATHMMDESIDNDECPKGYRSAYDAYDGKNQKSRELEDNIESQVQCNTINEDFVEKKEISNEDMAEVDDPSPTSIPAIKVGDRVEIEDCPGHWSSFSPFTVEAIEGELVKLEMVGELVEIERLAKE